MTELSAALDAFFANTQKRVLVIKGKWGVGKTFAWRQYLAAKADLPEKAISYVSLFGVRNLQQLKQLVLAKAVPRNRSCIAMLATKCAFLHRWLAAARMVPSYKDYVAATDIVAELMLKDYLVCLDDIERRDKELKLSQILGFVSVLKEENRCRIVLIFNEDVIAGDVKEQEDLNTYREKVVDTEVEHRPSVAENSRIGFPRLNDYPVVARVFEAMSVTNIRVVKFTEWNVKAFAPFIQNSQQAVADALFRNVAILTCLFHQHGKDIDFDRLEGRLMAFLWRQKDEKPTKAEQILRQAEFADSEFDPFVVHYLRTGCIDRDGLGKLVLVLDEREKKSQTIARYRDVWMLFQANFLATSKEFTQGMTSFLQVNLDALDPQDVDSLCEFFVKLGHPETAETWRDKHLAMGVETVTLEGIPSFRQRVGTSPELLAKLEAKAATLRNNVCLKDLVFGVVQKRGWSPHQVALLNSFTENDYFDWISTEADNELIIILREFRQTATDMMADPKWTEILAKVDGALSRIGAKDEFNRLRVELLFKMRIEPSSDTTDSEMAEPELGGK